ncbi:hypothetical protein JOB18_028209 [Solea senegalensis]|uniref:Cilia- and flagella-associated protein 157 n=1 Tax=Solea senegalensis TaxID=28829 RepID=A0AAV6R9Y5_SOLSE|nr:cilia- and flagella-associated protein 157-like [Solea senegalensis]KAG7500747.1 hypothetical protein JOB18_028209 [Solea senegalensis]
MAKGKKGKGGKAKTGDEKDKALYQAEIQYLQDQLQRCQQKCKQVEGQNEDLQSKFSALEKEKDDIAEYLQKSAIKKEQKLDDVLSRLEIQQHDAQRDRDAMQLEQEQLRQKFQDKVDKLQEEKEEFEKSMASLEEFRIQKEQLMSSMEALKKELADEKRDHLDEIHKLEMDALLERKKRDQKLENHLRAMEERVKDMVNEKVTDMTKLTLKENAEVSAKFIQLTEEAKVLMKNNCALRDRNSQLNVDVDSLEKMLAELSRKGGMRKAVMAKLGDKCQQLQREVKAFKQEYQQLKTKHDQCLVLLHNDLEALRQDRKALSIELRKKTEEASQCSSELKKVKTQWMKWWKILSWKMPSVSRPEGIADLAQYLEDEEAKDIKKARIKAALQMEQKEQTDEDTEDAASEEADI